MNITRADVTQLIREPSLAVRARIAEKVCDGFNRKEFGEKETQLAIEIFRLLLKDTEARVRAVLSNQLKNNFEVPREIALALANDVTEVAVPILEFSYVISEEDLVAITRATRDVPKLQAIARRSSVSKELSHELVAKRQPEVVKTLIRNSGAALAPETLETMLGSYAKDASVLEELVYRGGLPYAFAEKLFALVSDQLKKHLTKRYRLAKHVAEDAVATARETAMLSFISAWMSQQDIQNLVDSMHKNKRLNYSVIIRALCVGDLRFFESAIAKLVGVPVSNARILLLDPGGLGFRALYDSSGLPAAFFDSIKLLFDLAVEETGYGRYRRNDFGQRMIERIVAKGYHKTVDQMPYLMSILGRSGNESQAVH